MPAGYSADIAADMKTVLPMKKKTPIEIYNARASQPDFCRLEDTADRFAEILIAFEDPLFYSHRGISVPYFFESLSDALKGKGLKGNSTIDQQLVKNLYFDFGRSWIRKLKEAFITLYFTKKLTKKQILELYYNIIYYDNGQYGIVNASRYYFSKTPKQLTINQIVFLINTLPIVGIYNPLYHPDDFVRFRNRKMGEIKKYLDKTSEDIIPEAMKHGAECLDEQLRCVKEEAKKYDNPGPKINERFGPGMPESLIADK